MSQIYKNYSKESFNLEGKPIGHDIFLRLAMLVAFIPSVNFSLTNLDTQPLAIILSIICLIISAGIKIPVVIWFLALPLLASIFLALSSSSTLVGIRAIVTYASPLAFACMSYLAFQKKIDIARYIVFMIYLWAIAGVIQWFVDPDVLKLLVNARTSLDRGVTGLAPEPSFYGMTVIQMWLLLLLSNQSIALKLHIIFICLLQILILAQSALAIIVLLVLFVIFMMKSRYRLITGLLILMSGLVVITYLDDIDSRLFSLMKLFIAEPSMIIYLDASVAERFTHIFLSVKYAFNSGLVPHGFDSFLDIMAAEQASNPIFWYGNPQNKIISGVGSVFFELGFFAIIYFVVFGSYLYKLKDMPLVYKLMIAFGFFLVMINSVTLAAPYFGLMIGLMAAKSNQKRIYL